MKKLSSSSSVSGPPSLPSSPGSSRALMIVDMMSSAGFLRFSAIRRAAVVAQSPRILPGNDLGRRRGDAGIDPLGKLCAVLLRHAEQQADRLQRQITGEAGDEIERLVLGQRLDQSHGAAAQLRLQLMDGAVGEALVDEAAQPLVAGIVSPVEELAGLVLVMQARAAGRAAATLVGGERDRIQHDGHGILVPAHHPEPLPIRRHGRRLMPVDGGMLARPGEVVVRKALRKRGIVREIDVGGLNQVSDHCRLPRQVCAAEQQTCNGNHRRLKAAPARHSLSINWMIAGK